MGLVFKLSPTSLSFFSLREEEKATYLLLRNCIQLASRMGTVQLAVFPLTTQYTDANRNPTIETPASFHCLVMSLLTELKESEQSTI